MNIFWYLSVKLIIRYTTETWQSIIILLNHELSYFVITHYCNHDNFLAAKYWLKFVIYHLQKMCWRWIHCDEVIIRAFTGGVRWALKLPVTLKAMPYSLYFLVLIVIIYSVSIFITREMWIFFKNMILFIILIMTQETYFGTWCRYLYCILL